MGGALTASGEGALKPPRAMQQNPSGINTLAPLDVLIRKLA